MPERYLGQPLGKYRVESLLGSGGFAWVFKGYDPELDIPVAIKVLKPQFAGDGTLVERFRREASTAAKLRHPNIIKIYAVGREGDAVYFVMDYLPGGLADRLEATPHLPEDYVVRIGIDVARALGFAHREGVIHRDIKVDNILFDTHGNAVVADFGIARAVSGYTHQTGTNMVVGTPQYFAPEQARAKPLDGRADIYSLGVTLFRSVTGRLPFEGDDWYEIARQHVEEPPPSPRSINSAVSGEFDRLLLRCLAKTPEERPATGEQLADDLERILALHRDPSASRTLTMASTGGTTVIAPVASLTKGPVRRVTSARVLVPGALVVAGLVAAGVLVFGSLSDGGASPPLPDSTGVVGTDTTTVEFAPADSGATGSANPAGREGGRAGSSSATRGGATASVARATLRIEAPPGADVYVNGTRLPAGVTQLDTIPGEYRVYARVVSVPNCPSAVTPPIPVVLRPGTQRTIPLEPQPCGWLEISGEGRKAGRRVEGTSTRYRILENGRQVVEGPLPTFPDPVRLVLPVGTYQVVVSQSLCADHTENGVRVEAETTSRVGPAFPFCP